MSFTYKMNIRGPNMDPWAVPYVIGETVDAWVFIIVRCDLFCMYDSKNFRELRSRPYSF